LLTFLLVTVGHKSLTDMTEAECCNIARSGCFVIAFLKSYFCSTLVLKYVHLWKQSSYKGDHSSANFLLRTTKRQEIKCIAAKHENVRVVLTNLGCFSCSSSQ